jgi:hypothetical protein
MKLRLQSLRAKGVPKKTFYTLEVDENITLNQLLDEISKICNTEVTLDAINGGIRKFKIVSHDSQPIKEFLDGLSHFL